MSNVYYLPVPAVTALGAAPPPPVPSVTWRQALTRAWSRLRFTWLEFRHAVRPPVPLALDRRAAGTSPDARQHALLRDHAALLGAQPARPAVPARIFDLAAARARRARV
jgi:hypothetical protein